MSREIALQSLTTPALQQHTQLGPEDVARAFLEGRNEHTRKAYDRDLRDFAEFLGVGSPRMAIAALICAGKGQAHAMALSFRAHLLARGLAPTTIGRRLAALRSAIELAGQIGQVDWELSISSPSGEAYRDTSGPGEAGWRSVRDAAKADAGDGSPTKGRDLAIVRLLHDQALRREEVCRLDLADVDLDDRDVPSHVWILGKKRSQKERLSLAAPTSAALAAWIAERGPHPGPLFVRLDPGASAERTQRITGRSIHRLVVQLGERAGLRKQLRPHGLRHQAITEALDRTGGDVRKVQRFSRHKDLRTLTIYDDRRRDGAGEVSRLIADDE